LLVSTSPVKGITGSDVSEVVQKGSLLVETLAGLKPRQSA
jgi:hypothetical protein